MTCEHCGRSHRSQEAVDQCGIRLANRQARMAKKAEDQERRLQQESVLSFRQYIRQEVGAGKQTMKVVAELKRLYPNPDTQGYFPDRYYTGPGWHELDVNQVYAQTLNWGLE